MGAFDPISALLGGGLIGLASVLLMLLNGRIAGISGMLGGALTMSAEDKVWRLAFIAGLIVAPIIIGLFGHPLPEPEMPANWLLIVAAGVLVGFGARYGGGCTSGHGVCGLARLSARSIVATAIFMVSSMIVVPVVNSMQLARDAESDDPLPDVGSLQNNFLDCRRSTAAARGVGGRDSPVAATDHRAATR